MDIRHYDTIGHGLEMAYEDWKGRLGTIRLGTANTHETDALGTRGRPHQCPLVGMEKTAPSLPCWWPRPEYYHATAGLSVFWTCPDRSTPPGAPSKKPVDNAFDFYNHEVDQRGWYGFWDYGDMMRSTTKPRHQYKYDIGGWPGTTPNCARYWLWYKLSCAPARADRSSAWAKP